MTGTPIRLLKDIGLPAGFLAAAIYVVWNMPMYINALDLGSQALRSDYGNAGALEWVILLFAAILFVIGCATVRNHELEAHEARDVDRFALFVGRVTMILVVLLVVVMCAEVILRYIFASPTTWANELSLWIAGVIFLASGPYAMQQRIHIGITVIYDRMPPWMMRCCDVISVAITVLLAIALIYGATSEAWGKLVRWETSGTTFGAPIPATLKVGVLLAIALIAIQAFANLIRDWKTKYLPVTRNQENGENRPIEWE